MPGVAITVIDHASEMLRRGTGGLKDFRRPLDLCGKYMFAETMRQFKTAGARSGNPWPPLSPQTIRGRRKKSRAILQDTGRLRDSVTTRKGVYELTPKYLRMGSNLAYARIHQKGGTIHRISRAGSAILTRSRKTPSGLSFTSRKRMLRLTSGRMKQFRYVSWSGGKSFTIGIPARPFLVVTKQDEEQFVRIFERCTIEGFKK